ncbi:MAG TPA: YtxH domain-containing protein [Candidatus Krumholzibacteria bacterium]|nr:YtxH domain-containing protein [Candidatus Krumholzibacteria bacterium]
MSKENTALAFVAGALAGGITALLLAPQSGRETRAVVQDTARDSVEQGREKVEHAANTAAERTREAAESVADRTRHASETVAETASHATDTAQDRVEATREAFEAGREAYAEELRRRQEQEAKA